VILPWVRISLGMALESKSLRLLLHLCLPQRSLAWSVVGERKLFLGLINGPVVPVTFCIEKFSGFPPVFWFLFFPSFSLTLSSSDLQGLKSNFFEGWLFPSEQARRVSSLGGVSVPMTSVWTSSAVKPFSLPENVSSRGF